MTAPEPPAPPSLNGQPPLYHGTRLPFRGAGGLLLPVDVHGGEARAGHIDGGTAYVYVTDDWEQAVWYAHQAKGRGKPRVLTVMPFGPVEPDPTPYDNEEDQYRCADGAKVLRVTMLADPPDATGS